MIISLLDCLDIKRFDNYDDWFKICCILKNENMNFKLFDDYSKKFNKYDRNSCIQTWNSIKGEHVKFTTLGTLKYMAKDDNLMNYIGIIKSEVPLIMKEIFKFGINDKLTAELFYSLKVSNYLYVVENKTWYYIDKYNIYHLDESQINLKTNINKTISPEIEKYYISTLKNSEEEHKQKLTKTYSSILKYLGTAKNKIGIIDELALLYQQNNLYEKMDNMNHYLIGFNNGVYDLQNNIFRNAKPEELITTTTGYNYMKPKKTEKIKNGTNIKRYYP